MKKVSKKTSEVTDAELHRAISVIMKGDYYQLNENLLQPLVDKIAPFIEYVKNQKHEESRAQAD